METSNPQESITNITSKDNTVTRDGQSHSNTPQDKSIKRKSSAGSQDSPESSRRRVESQTTGKSITVPLNPTLQPALLNTSMEQESMVLSAAANSSAVDPMKRIMSLLPSSCAQSNNGDAPNGDAPNGDAPNGDAPNAYDLRSWNDNSDNSDKDTLRNKEQISEMQTAISGLKDKLEASTLDLNDKVDLLLDNTKQIYDNEQLINNVTTALGTVKGKVRMLSNSVEQMTGTKTSILTLSENITSLQNQSRDLQQSYNNLTGDVQQLQGQNKKLQKQYEELQKRNTDLQQNYDHLMRDVKALQEQNVKLRTQHKELRKQYEDLTSLANEAKSLQRERGRLQQQHNNLQNISQVSQEQMEDPLFISMQPDNALYNIPYYTPYGADNYYNYNNIPLEQSYSTPPVRNAMIAHTSQVNITPYTNQDVIPIGEAINSADYYHANTIVASQAQSSRSADITSQIHPSHDAEDNYSDVLLCPSYSRYLVPTARNMRIVCSPQITVTSRMDPGDIHIGTARNVNTIATPQVPSSRHVDGNNDGVTPNSYYLGHPARAVMKANTPQAQSSNKKH